MWRRGARAVAVWGCEDRALRVEISCRARERARGSVGRARGREDGDYSALPGVRVSDTERRWRDFGLTLEGRFRSRRSLASGGFGGERARPAVERAFGVKGAPTARQDRGRRERGRCSAAGQLGFFVRGGHASGESADSAWIS